MNVQKTITLTAAEEALIASFGRLSGSLPGNAAVTMERDRLVGDIRKSGLPTRRVEAWHYTDLRNLLRNIPDESGEAVNPVAGLLPDTSVLALVQGRAGHLPEIDGVTGGTTSDALSEGDDAMNVALSRPDDAIGRINGALVSDGYVIDIAQSLEAPVEIQAVHGGGQVHSRNRVTFADGVSGTVVERHLAPEGDAALVSTLTAITLGKDTEVTYVVMQQQGAEDTHLGKLKIELGENAKLKLLIVNAGGKLVRHEIDCAVVGEGADLMLRGVNLLGGETHTDITFDLGHNVPNTTSTEVIRNVVFDKARGVFQGLIRVAPDAQKTDAKMSCNTLLMSDFGAFNAKPELEIFADDVQCGHGATVTDIDPNHLYYLMARGIPKKVVTGMLINAFVAEIVEELENEALSEAVEAIIADWLDRHE
ncbi:Fe-S cluster assembly protein SufD [Martelella endophytica]|uniref:ABC transporter ATP-binding protein n=1 Tax=Martelella endophytica TaxID=1486262 RepID=A0A0D5LT08_MAREN|nr:Fe-S cluster assembly protein SufD [Martelella endophytica]AJY47105.1 ABC transporter ATP-binding protein [Martelella endophytica]